jgi:hypothetical protein
MPRKPNTPDHISAPPGPRLNCHPTARSSSTSTRAPYRRAAWSAGSSTSRPDGWRTSPHCASCWPSSRMFCASQWREQRERPAQEEFMPVTHDNEVTDIVGQRDAGARPGQACAARRPQRLRRQPARRVYDQRGRTVRSLHGGEPVPERPVVLSLRRRLHRQHQALLAR